MPTTTAQNADIVLGQNSFTSNVENDDDQDGVAGSPSAKTLYFPATVRYANNKIYVTD